MTNELIITNELKERFSKSFSLNVSHETLKDGTEREIYNIPLTKKDKDGNETTELIAIRNSTEITNLSDFDLFAYASKVSVKASCIASARIKKETAESCGYKSVVAMLYKLHPDYSQTTLKMYRRIGRIFGDLSADGYLWREDIPQAVSVNNLSVVVSLLGLEDTESVTDEEIERAYNNFINDYILTDKIHLLLPQAKLKKEVSDIKNGIIDGSCQEVEKTADTSSDDTSSETEVTPETEKAERHEEYKNMLSVMSEEFKENKTILKAIATIIKELSKE